MTEGSTSLVDAVVVATIAMFVMYIWHVYMHRQRATYFVDVAVHAIYI